LLRTPLLVQNVHFIQPLLLAQSLVN